MPSTMVRVLKSDEVQGIVVEARRVLTALISTHFPRNCVGGAATPTLQTLNLLMKAFAMDEQRDEVLNQFYNWVSAE